MNFEPGKIIKLHKETLKQIKVRCPKSQTAKFKFLDLRKESKFSSTLDIVGDKLVMQAESVVEKCNEKVMLFKVCILKASYDDFNTCFSKSIIFTLQPDEIQHIQIPQKYSSSSFSFQQKLSKRFPFSPKRILLKLMSIPHILHFHCPSAKYCDNIESPQNFIQSLDFNNVSSKSKKDIQRKLVCYP